MHLDELDRLHDEARRTLKLKIDNAEKGHDWVVDAHTITSTKLLELVALARLGWPIWKSGS